MNVKILFSSLLLLLVTTGNMPALAQSDTGSSPLTTTQQVDKINDIKKMLALTGAKYVFQQTLEQSLASTKSQHPQIPQEFWDAFMAEVSVDEMLNRLIPIYNKYLSAEDIKELIKFYETPLGKKTVNVLPQITRESIEVSQQYGIESAKRVLQKLEAEGYVRQ